MVGIEDRHIGVLSVFPKPINNKVIVRIYHDPEMETTESGLYKGNSWWDETGHLVRYGEVVSVCDSLIEREQYGFGVEWGTEIEVKKGDTVYFTKMEAYNSPLFSFEGNLYAIMDYSELILRIRVEEYYPLNGYVIVKKVEETASSTLIVDFAKQQNKSKGIVKWCGKQLGYYFPKSSEIVEAEDINEGDMVLFSLAGFTSLEDSRYAKLDTDLGYIQRRWIVAKLID